MPTSRGSLQPGTCIRTAGLASITSASPWAFRAPRSTAQFDVDRFAPPRNEHQQPGICRPFGLGTHHGIGPHLAEFVTTAAMATILQDAVTRQEER